MSFEGSSGCIQVMIMNDGGSVYKVQNKCAK